MHRSPWWSASLLAPNHGCASAAWTRPPQHLLRRIHGRSGGEETSPLMDSLDPGDPATCCGVDVEENPLSTLHAINPYCARHAAWTKQTPTHPLATFQHNIYVIVSRMGLSSRLRTEISCAGLSWVVEHKRANLACGLIVGALTRRCPNPADCWAAAAGMLPCLDRYPAGGACTCKPG